MHERIKNERGVLIIFSTIRMHEESHSLKELSKGLVLWKKVKGGWIYVHPDGLPNFFDN